MYDNNSSTFKTYMTKMAQNLNSYSEIFLNNFLFKVIKTKWTILPKGPQATPVSQFLAISLLHEL